MSERTRRRGFVPPNWTPPVPSPEQVASVEGRFFPYRFPYVVIVQNVLIAAIGLMGFVLFVMVVFRFGGAPISMRRIVTCALALAVLVAAGRWSFRFLRRRIERALSRCCVECGYDIRETLDRCPECGHRLM